jgi:hypothetical protein
MPTAAATAFDLGENALGKAMYGDNYTPLS